MAAVDGGASMIKPYADNVILVLEPLETLSASGLSLVNLKNPKDRIRGSRTARVIASGPGYWYSRRRRLADRTFTEPTEVFVPNETRPGDRVIVDSNPGQDYALDITIPRTNINAEFTELLGDKAEFRVVREAEIYAVLGQEAEAAE